MFKKAYCTVCGGEIRIRYHTPDKNFTIRNGQITRDDIHKGMIVNQPELLFECPNDREHYFHIPDPWEENVREEFYKGAYYE